MTDYIQRDLRELETIGCDLGDRKSELFAIRPDETSYRPKPIATTREGFRGFFEGRAKTHVVLEVGTHSRWTSFTLEAMGHVVTVANPRNVKLISEATNKDDVVDAEKLARLGRADVKLLSPIKHRGDQVQADLAIVKVRDALVRCRTRLVNQARSLTKSFGFRLPACDAHCFHRKTKQDVPEQLRPALDPVYAFLEQMHIQIAALDKRLKEVAEARYPDLDVVSQPKGVGLLTGLVFLMTIEDKKRITKSRDVGPLVGLTPRRRKSSNSDPQLRITKAGDPLLRQLLVQSAHFVLGPFGEESDLRHWGLELAKRGGKSAKKRACVAVARKLAVLMHRLWVTGEAYQPVGYKQIQKPAAMVAA